LTDVGWGIFPACVKIKTLICGEGRVHDLVQLLLRPEQSRRPSPDEHARCCFAAAREGGVLKLPEFAATRGCGVEIKLLSSWRSGTWVPFALGEARRSGPGDENLAGVRSTSPAGRMILGFLNNFA